MAEQENVSDLQSNIEQVNRLCEGSIDRPSIAALNVAKVLHGCVCYPAPPGGFRGERMQGITSARENLTEIFPSFPSRILPSHTVEEIVDLASAGKVENGLIAYGDVTNTARAIDKAINNITNEVNDVEVLRIKSKILCGTSRSALHSNSPDVQEQIQTYNDIGKVGHAVLRGTYKMMGAADKDVPSLSEMVSAERADKGISDIVSSPDNKDTSLKPDFTPKSNIPPGKGGRER